MVGAIENTARCRICGGAERSSLFVREMMFGSRENFRYFECVICGCLQIADIPTDLGRHYPDDYYSFARAAGGLKERLKRVAIRTTLRASGFVGPLHAALVHHGGDIGLLARYQALCPDRGARIIDVGSGAGRIVLGLRNAGYQNAAGIDQFVTGDTGRNPVVRRAELSEINGLFDLISFNHSLEHMPNQVEALTGAREKLAPGGKIMVRLPVVGGKAWRQYGADWVQIDAPRHLYLHSRKSLEIIARGAGLRMDSITFDSTPYQFWGSELLRSNISLNDPRSATLRAEGPKRYAAAARALNAREDGDQVMVVLSA
jgi:SAM-dependent methyltransferase